MSGAAAEQATSTPQRQSGDDHVDEVAQAFRALETAMRRGNSSAAQLQPQLQQLVNGQAYIFAGLSRIETLIERLVRVTERQLETTRAQESYAARTTNMQLSWVRSRR